MKKSIFKKRIFAILTAPCLLLAAPMNVGRAWDGNGAAVFVAHGESTSASTFLASTYFFGESTTAHLSRHGGVLDTPLYRFHVWKDESGTRILDRRILSSHVTCALPTGDAVDRTLEEALRTVRPQRLVLSFGLNGLCYFHSNQTAFLADYRRLIEGIRASSPNTEIVVQSIYPVGENSAFSLPAPTLNAYIEVLNARLAELCMSADGVFFADTARLLRDASGSLKKEYDTGDGIHLTNEAYRQILSYLSMQFSKEEPT